jgi:hypothetical protein
MMYLVVFLAAMAVDLIPIVAPPAWMLMVLLLAKFDLNPWITLLAGVPGSTLGRYLFSLYIGKFSHRFVKDGKREELEFLGKKMGQKLWPSWIFVFIYTLTPLSTSALFTAAAMAKAGPARTLPPFFVGKFISDAVMIFAGRYAISDLHDLTEGMFSVKGITFIVLGVVVVGGFLFVDWRELLEHRKFKINFRIWK